MDIAVPFHRANVDTDQIIPARFIMKPRRFDYGTALFHDLRFGPSAESGFPLDRPEYEGAAIMVTAENFACGSAREQAVWALQGFGIRVLIGPSFGGIFYANCMKNGILPAIVEPEIAAALARELETRPGTRLGVDLATQRITTEDGRVFDFAIAASHKAQLQGGKDDITRTLELEAAIVAHEEKLAATARWTRPLLEPATPRRTIALQPVDE
jgi:3-isopropylmalate/(R)-2-methylmalate dehydratase small subunit